MASYWHREAAEELIRRLTKEKLKLTLRKRRKGRLAGVEGGMGTYSIGEVWEALQHVGDMVNLFIDVTEEAGLAVCAAILIDADVVNDDAGIAAPEIALDCQLPEDVDTEGAFARVSLQ